MKINNVGYHFVHSSNFMINRPRGSGDYCLLFLRSGAQFTVNGRTVRVRPQSFIFYRKGTPQHFGADGDRFSNDWLHLDLTEAEHRELVAMGIPFDTPVDCGDITYFSQIIKNMYQEKYSANRNREKTLFLYFQLIVTKLSERMSDPALHKNRPYYEKLSALRVRIYSRPSEPWTVARMATEISLSESYFQHLYKETFGVSAVADVINCRIEQAKYLLSGTAYSISSVAEACGYKNDVHFMRQFKEVVGITPSHYRNRFGVSYDELTSGREKAPYRVHPD